MIARGAGGGRWRGREEHTSMESYRRAKEGNGRGEKEERGERERRGATKARKRQHNSRGLRSRRQARQFFVAVVGHRSPPSFLLLPSPPFLASRERGVGTKEESREPEDERTGKHSQRIQAPLPPPPAPSHHRGPDCTADSPAMTSPLVEHHEIVTSSTSLSPPPLPFSDCRSLQPTPFFLFLEGRCE